MSRQKEDAWREAQRRCRLSDDEVSMAKALGFQPKSLIRNIPSSSQPWKAPVNEWVRSLYDTKIGSSKLPTGARPEAPPAPKASEARMPGPRLWRAALFAAVRTLSLQTLALRRYAEGDSL
jgi:hypothetical protein